MDKIKSTYSEDLIKFCQSLPPKDKALAEKFVKNRNFTSLKELLESITVLTKKNELRYGKNSKFKDVNIADISSAMGIVCSLLDILGEDPIGNNYTDSGQGIYTEDFDVIYEDDDNEDF